MDQVERDGAAVRFPPPLVYLLAILAGVLLHLLVHPLRLALPLDLRIGLAGAAALIGGAMVGAAFRLFRRTGQDPRPWASTPQIISTGVYRFTRNPMYVGVALLQAAIGIGVANGWIVALVPVSLVVVYFIAVRHEEAYLAAKFGAAYLEYTQRVRRWL